MKAAIKSPATGGNRREAQALTSHTDYIANETLTTFNRAFNKHVGEKKKIAREEKLQQQIATKRERAQ